MVLTHLYTIHTCNDTQCIVSLVVAVYPGKPGSRSRLPWVWFYIRKFLYFRHINHESDTTADRFENFVEGLSRFLKEYTPTKIALSSRHLTALQLNDYKRNKKILTKLASKYGVEINYYVKWSHCVIPLEFCAVNSMFLNEYGLTLTE
jgi:hypothetical protein